MPTATLLIETHPDIATEWHPTRNGGLDLATLGTFSNKKVWWLHVDARGDVHEWQQIIRNRAYEGTGCPTCRDRDPNEFLHPFQPPKPGMSLADRDAEMTGMWHPTRNGDLTPDQVTLRSIRHVWWTCDQGHEWVRTVMRQAQARNDDRVCPQCREKKFGGQAKPIARNFPRLVAEWHPTRNADIDLTHLNATSALKVWWLGECGHTWKASIRSRTAGSGCSKCRGVGAGSARTRAWAEGCATSLADKAPHIAAEWHPTRNGDLTPADLSYGSGQRVWWQCSAGHEWNNTVNSRTGRDRGCWCCARPARVPAPETIHDLSRSLAAVRPDLAAQWHPTRNGLVTPETISARSDQGVWWQCSEGHVWTSKVASRTGANNGCRACANTEERARRAA